MLVSVNTDRLCPAALSPSSAQGEVGAGFGRWREGPQQTNDTCLSFFGGVGGVRLAYRRTPAASRLDRHQRRVPESSEVVEEEGGWRGPCGGRRVVVAERRRSEGNPELISGIEIQFPEETVESLKSPPAPQ